MLARDAAGRVRCGVQSRSGPSSAQNGARFNIKYKKRASYSTCVPWPRMDPGSVLLRVVSFVRIFHAARLRLVLIDNALQTRDVLQQALGAQPQEVVAELRILEVNFEQPVIGDSQHLPILAAFKRLRAPGVVSEKTKLAY